MQSHNNLTFIGYNSFTTTIHRILLSPSEDRPALSGSPTSAARNPDFTRRSVGGIPMLGTSPDSRSGESACMDFRSDTVSGPTCGKPDSAH